MTAGGPPVPPPQVPGQSDGGQPFLPPPPPVYPVATYYTGPQTGPAPGIAYAGFWIRFVATIIDTIIIGVPLVILFVITEGSTLTAYTNCVNSATATGLPVASACGATLGSIAYWELVGFLVELVYFVVLWSRFGGTLGQRMLGLHVVDAATGRNISIGRAIGRFVGYVISGIALDIGFIWAAFDARKQGWHDKIASTFVVRKV